MKKKAKKLISKKKIRNGERVRLQGLVATLSQNRDELGVRVRRQADELKTKNGQLKNGAVEQARSEEQIHLHAKAMESTTDGIFIVDAQKPTFPIIYVNQSFQKMVGCPKRDILGKNYFLFYGAGSDPRIVKEIERTLQKGRSFHGELFDLRKNGKRHWNSLRVAPVRDAGGAVTHYVGIQTDVTSLREKEAEIDEQREELLHVTRVGKLAEFVSSLAHEISQPLTAILSYAQAAQRMLAGREPQLRKVLSYIVDDNQRAAEVIRRMRSLLKKSKSDMKPLDINALINDTLVLIATDSAVRNTALKIELESGLPLVRGDRIQLQQVLLNLISNSFDALEGDQGPREILFRTSHKDAGTIVVEVVDSGCGIPVPNLPKLFTRFFTSKPDGLGMGLSISRSIVEAHGGCLDVRNNPDRGVTFHFTLPVGTKDAP